MFESSPVINGHVDAPLQDASTWPGHRRRWLEDEDSRLRRAVLLHGTRKWDVISEYVGTRKEWQCRERWNQHLRPDLNKADWSHEEDETILRMVDMIGHKWKQISECLQGRASTSVKNRYYLITKDANGERSPGPQPTASVWSRKAEIARSHHAVWQHDPFSTPAMPGSSIFPTDSVLRSACVHVTSCGPAQDDAHFPSKLLATIAAHALPDDDYAKARLFELVYEELQRICTAP